MRTAKLILIALGLLVAACSSDDGASGSGQDSQDPENSPPSAESTGGENLTFQDDNLSFPAADETADGENITFSDPFRDSTEENIRFEPMEIPETDFTQAATETEPNEGAEAATSLTALPGVASDKSQFAARGTLSGKDTDLYKLVTEGEPQLWYLEIIGQGVSRVYYVDAAGQQHAAQKMAAEDAVHFMIANLLLPPGEHWIRVEGKEVGEYTVRALPLGPPDKRSELEPNNDKSRAQGIPVDMTVSGLLYPERDKDFFRFSLFADELVAIRFEPPDGLSAQIELAAVQSGGGQQNLVWWRSSEPGERMDYYRMLPPGDYLLPVIWNGNHSKVPYRLRVERLDPWSSPSDLEPNDEASFARPVPASLSLQGSVSGRDDDWYRLPVTETTTKVTIRPTGPKPRSLRLLGADNEGRSDLLRWNDESGIYEGELPAGLQANLEIRGAGPYELGLELDPPIAVTDDSAEELPVEITFAPGSRHFAAYLDWPQRGRFQAMIRNRGAETVDLELELRSSHYDWKPALSEKSVTLPPGSTQTVDITVQLARDAGSDLPVRVSLGARDPSGRVARSALSLVAQCAAGPVSPMASGALPEPLLGGVNVAWSAMGAAIIANDDMDSKSLENVNDGLTPSNHGWWYRTKEYPVSLTVDLAGDEPVPVTGVLLHSLAGRSSEHWVRDFDVLLSEDGATFQKVYSGTLQRLPIEQSFVFESAVPARFARLKIRSTQSDQSQEVSLGEWKVIAAVGQPVAGVRRYNLADPALGGHVVWSSWQANLTSLESMLTDGAGPRFRADPNLPNQWVIGFHHDRAAQIEELQWRDNPSGSRPLTNVQVAVSTNSPIGPWQPAGTWDLERGPEGVRPFRFAAPTWARFVRFSSTEPDRPERWDLPQTLRVIERPVGDDYRSILGEWGHYSRQAAYELQHIDKVAANNEADSNDRREDAQPLSPGAAVQGNVTLGEDTDWFAVTIPQDSNALRISLKGAPRLKARLALFDESGEPIPDVKTVVEPLQTFVDANVTGGSRVLIRVEEPPRAVAFIWDNSGSVGPFRETIYQAMSRFSGEVKPGLEFGNLLPFQDDGGSFLLPSWSDQPHVLQATLNNYDRKDGSSDAESALLVAAKAFSRWDGTRAAVFLTDAESPGYRRTSQLWTALAEAQPHVFTLHLHQSRGSIASRTQDLMQGWSSVNGGYYTFFRAQSDLDAAFERAACYIRRPAAYVIEAATRYEEPPGPGFLSVEAQGTISANAVELILDASGSMLQRLDGTRRIEIARNVLTDLVNETIPEGTSLALRVFGHRKPDACDTDLAVPLQPLNRAKVTGVIQSTQAMNLARTPIGDSLVRVADDLENVEGQKLIILITDGEETCDGDPAGAIANLKEAGHDVRINVVGFAIDDAALKTEFESWARMGGGLYFNASSAAELDEALKDAMRPKFQVLDDTASIIAAGTTGGEALEIPSGTYTVKILTSPVQTFDQVTIEPEETTRISATAD